jgi:uncharacterized membrane protein
LDQDIKEKRIGLNRQKIFSDSLERIPYQIKRICDSRAKVTNGMKRIFSIDFTRGLVMIIMALDHVRDMMHTHSITQNPVNLATTTPALFFTRWITYLCAPTFVFLAGSSAYLSFKNKADSSKSRQFLLTRGLWLILLEFTFVNFGLFFDFGFHTFIFEVIAAIGFGFIALSSLLKASWKTIGIIGLIIIIGHDVLRTIPMAEGSVLKTILTPLFSLEVFSITPHTNLTIAYPPIPWLGIMLVGFACGKLFELPDLKRKNVFLKIGLGTLVFFTVLRCTNLYGDPLLWSSQKNGLYAMLSFINVTKYPPSLLFCLITLGIMFLILGLAENAKSASINTISVYGKVPLFYFVVHFYLIHIFMIALMFAQGFNWSQMDFASGTFGRPKGIESGVSLGAVYIIWMAVVLMLYRPCLWFGKYKTAHKKWWLKYI